MARSKPSICFDGEFMIQKISQNSQDERKLDKTLQSEREGGEGLTVNRDEK